MDWLKDKTQASSSTSTNMPTSADTPTSTAGPGPMQPPAQPPMQAPQPAQPQETMTVTQALVDLKTLDKRIQKLIQESVFVSLKGELRQPDVRISKAKSNYDKVRDLMNRRVKLKSAIVSSNALTRVKVADMDLTVAEAIELKSSVKNYKTLLGQLKAQYGNSVQQMEYDNQRVRGNLENTLKKIAEENKEQVSITDYSRTYMKMYGVELCDPIDAQKRMDELDKFISDFESSVDVVLSVKNATTMISI